MLGAGGIYIDGTYGRGGHSGELLKRLSPAGRLLAFDRDPVAVAHARAQYADDPRFEMVSGKFSAMRAALCERGYEGRVQGVLVDLGVSSPQIDDAERGFSFMNDGPLDMRMDTQNGMSAADWINHASVADMAVVFRELGEERHAKRIASAIERERKVNPFERTQHLAEVVTLANPTWEKHKHPATRVFQAIRIFINDELGELRSLLNDVVDMLAPHGRIAVIAFHSLEDRIVKQFLRAQSCGRELPRGVPQMGGPEGQTMRLVGKAIKPSEKEVSENPRARSAILRVGEKLGAGDGLPVAAKLSRGIKI